MKSVNDSGVTTSPCRDHLLEGQGSWQHRQPVAQGGSCQQSMPASLGVQTGLSGTPAIPVQQIIKYYTNRHHRYWQNSTSPSQQPDVMIIEILLIIMEPKSVHIH